MNYRLISTREKVANARGRNRRNARRQKQKRREKLLRNLALVVGADAVARDSLQSRECLDLLLGDLRRGRSLAKRVKLGAAAVGQGGECVPDHLKTNGIVATPARVLREQNRSNVFPWLLLDAPTPMPGLSVMQALEEARCLAHTGNSPHALVDFLASSAGITVEAAADLLSRKQIIPAPFTVEQLRSIRDGRRFWNLYAEGRAAYRCLVGNGEVCASAGDWGWFDSAGIESLLPGIHIPRLFRRPFFLLNLQNERAGLSLDFHAMSKLPMFRHPI